VFVWRDAIRNSFYRPVKKQLTLRLDADVIAWLRRHGLNLVQTKSGYECIMDADNFGRGADQDEACIDFCLKTKLPHWNQE